MPDPSTANLDRFRRLGLSLLPPGRALTTDDDSGVAQLVEGAVCELARVDEAADVLALEAVPSRADAYLEAYEEAIANVPAVGAALVDRRTAVVSRMLGRVDRRRAAYDAGAALLALTITKVETRAPFAVGNAVGDGLRGDAWAHALDIWVAPSTGGGFPTDQQLTHMRALVARLKRAHTVITVHPAEGQIGGGDPDAPQTPTAVSFRFTNGATQQAIRYVQEGHWVWPQYFERYAVNQSLESLAAMGEHIGDLMGWGSSFEIVSVTPSTPNVGERLGYGSATCANVVWYARTLSAPDVTSYGELRAIYDGMVALFDYLPIGQTITAGEVRAHWQTLVPGGLDPFLSTDPPTEDTDVIDPGAGNMLRWAYGLSAQIVSGTGVWNSEIPPDEWPEP